jgi:CheY-like chemotaxis protein
VSLVLAIEPDLRQAAIVKRIVREKVLSDVAVVDSRDAALEAIRTSMPDVLLISALLSPRDEDELIAHLRTLDNAGHLQTHTIPQLASALGPGERRASGGLLSAFRRKKKEPEVAPSGCDPDVFAEEIRSYLQRAADKKRELADGVAQVDAGDHAWRAAQPGTAAASTTDLEPAAETGPSSGSSWASPFEWKPSNPSSNPSSLIANPESPIANPESPIADPESPIASPESPIAGPELLIADSEWRVAERASRIAHNESPEPSTLMDHLRPPSGVTTLKALSDAMAAEESLHVAAPIEAPSQEIELAQVAAAIPDPEPIHEAAPIQVAAPIQDMAPIRDAAPIHDSAPSLEVTLSLDAAPGNPDKGSEIKGPGLGIQDQRSGIRDPRLGALASWARAERPDPGAAAQTDDVRALLAGLAVPTAVVAVGYGRGCRIRRVRVPPAREPMDPAAAGPVILSKRVLAEQREQSSRF